MTEELTERQKQIMDKIEEIMYEDEVYLECAICFTKESSKDVEKRCCLNICEPCSDEMCDLCPVCERDELNETHECKLCGDKEVRIGQFVLVYCEEHEMYHEGCINCDEKGYIDVECMLTIT